MGQKSVATSVSISVLLGNNLVWSTNNYRQQIWANAHETCKSL